MGKGRADYTKYMGNPARYYPLDPSWCCNRPCRGKGAEGSRVFVPPLARRIRNEN